MGELKQESIRFPGRANALDALRQNEDWFREILQHAHMVAITMDNLGAVRFSNDFFLELTGWKLEEIIGQDFFTRFIPEEHRGEVRERFACHEKSGNMPTHLELEILTRAGSRRRVYLHGNVVRDGSGKINGLARKTHKKRLSGVVM